MSSLICYIWVCLLIAFLLGLLLGWLLSRFFCKKSCDKKLEELKAEYKSEIKTAYEEGESNTKALLADLEQLKTRYESKLTEKGIVIDQSASSNTKALGTAATAGALASASTAANALTDAGKDAVSGAAEAAGSAVEDVADKATEAVSDAAQTARKEIVDPLVATAEKTKLEVIAETEKLPDFVLTSKPDVADDLKAINGIGPVMERMLNELGIYKFEQVAKLSPADEAWVSKHIETFPERIYDDKWVKQAKEIIAKA